MQRNHPQNCQNFILSSLTNCIRIGININHTLTLSSVCDNINFCAGGRLWFHASVAINIQHHLCGKLKLNLDNKKIRMCGLV